MDQQKEVFKCERCGTIFKRKGDHTRHMNRKNPCVKVVNNAEIAKEIKEPEQKGGKEFNLNITEDDELQEIIVKLKLQREILSAQSRQYFVELYKLMFAIAEISKELEKLGVEDDTNVEKKM
jgi:uncharacterized C2H2 Zn-finger protein